MKKTLTSIIAAMAAMAITTTAFAFTDTNGLNDIQMNVLNNAVENGIITGYEDDTVRPYGNLTRAEFAAMLCRAFHYNSDSSCTFADSASHWASAYIQACVERGAINGIGGNLFDPEAPVTFNQATKIVSIVGGMTNGIDIDSLGGYPLAYLTVGQSNGLFDNLTYGMTGEDYSLSRIDAITMIENAKVPNNKNTSNAIIDNPEGKEIMTNNELKSYILTNSYGEFANLGEKITESLNEITYEAFKKIVIKEMNINDATDYISRTLNEENIGSVESRTNYREQAHTVLEKALRRFSEDGHQNENVIIID